MSWLVTARTHTEISDAISQRLQDTGEGIWEDAEKNKIIKDALEEISRYVPYKVKDESLTFASATRELDVSSIKDIIRIVMAEWIVGQEPRQFRNVEWLDEHTIRIVLESLPSSGDYCYLYIDKYHHLDPPWVTSTAYVKGDIVSPTKANRTGYRYECTTAGTSNSSEPSWGTTVGDTTSDDTVTWTCRGEVPNSLHDGDNRLEDVFIDLCVARALEDKALNHVNKVNVGSARALEQYIAASNNRLAKVLARLRRMAKANTKQWYPTA